MALGWIKTILGLGTTVEQVSGVFRQNAERAGQRDGEYNAAALAQYAAEFQPRSRRTWFDSIVDGLNRLVRPVITVSILGVIPAVIVYPENTAVAFAALALLPAGYWALVSIIVTFYYGGRMQMKSQDFHKSVKDAVAVAPQVIENMRKLKSAMSPKIAEDDSADIKLEIAEDLTVSDNPVIDRWRPKK